MSALQMAAWAWALHHFFFLPSGTVCLSYVLLGKKIEFCFKSGYFQMDCVQLCDQMFHNQLGSRTMDKRGWQGWVVGSEGWYNSAQMSKIFRCFMARVRT